MNAWVLLLVMTGVPGETPSDGAKSNQGPEADRGSAYSTTYTPVGIVSGEVLYGRAYAETGWPGPPAVWPPGLFARVCGCLCHKPRCLPPPPVIPFACPPPRPPESKSSDR